MFVVWLLWKCVKLLLDIYIGEYQLGWVEYIIDILNIWSNIFFLPLFKIYLKIYLLKDIC